MKLKHFDFTFDLGPEESRTLEKAVFRPDDLRNLWMGASGDVTLTLGGGDGGNPLAIAPGGKQIKLTGGEAEVCEPGETPGPFAGVAMVNGITVANDNDSPVNVVIRYVLKVG